MRECAYRIRGYFPHFLGNDSYEFLVSRFDACFSVVLEPDRTDFFEKCEAVCEIGDTLFEAIVGGYCPVRGAGFGSGVGAEMELEQGRAEIPMPTFAL